MQQVRVSRSLVLLVAAPACLTTSKDHQTTSEHRQKMVRLFAVNHSHLFGRTVQQVIDLDGLQRSDSSLILGRLPTQPVVDDVVLSSTRRVRVQDDIAVSSVSPRGYHMMTEGQEKEEFWSVLGGKGDYSNSPRLQMDSESRPARLFHCSNASGSFIVNEILDFVQQDLLTEDVFLLDAYDNVYVWLGHDARPDEKTMAMDAALDYVDSDPSGRDKDTPVYLIKQGLEPPDFIGYFGVWDRDLWSRGKTYEQLKAELGEKNLPIEEVRTKNAVNGDVSFSELAIYPYDLLCRKTELPDGIDPSHKEKHLSTEEFQKVFQMSYSEFVGLPHWKQQQLKKQFQLW